MTTFSDDDLKRLKEDCMENPTADFRGYSCKRMMMLVRRLEMAENLIRVLGEMDAEYWDGSAWEEAEYLWLASKGAIQCLPETI